jgi:hypothetical protein
MSIRHAVQRLGTDTQKITIFTDSQAALHRIKNDKEGPEYVGILSPFLIWHHKYH